MNGAPEVVMRHCDLSKAAIVKWMEQLENMGDRGFRLVGLANKEVGNKSNKIKTRDLNKMRWMGVLVFEDPVRAGVGESLKAAIKAGIKVKVITGDYRNTAVAVFEKLQVTRGKLKAEEIMDGEELKRLGVSEFEKRVDKVRLFVRTTPDQKLKIVSVLKKRGEVVAMTGDGVNDAPAIKEADIGVVVNEASDVSKETADMVLLDNNFATIVAAVQEGRSIYETMRKVVVYLLSSSFTELILVAGSLLLGLPLPVTAVQILWVNLIEDSLPSLALAFERSGDEVMADRPRKRDGPLLDKEMKALIFVVGIATDIVLLGLYLILYGKGLDIVLVRTVIFVGLAIDSLFYVFAVKSLSKNIWEDNLLNNKFLLLAVGVGILMLVPAVSWAPLQRLLETQALPVWAWVVLIGLGMLKLVAIEIVKYLFLRKGRVERELHMVAA